MKTNIILILSLLFSNFTFSQKDGFWDKERATTKEVTVSAGEKIILKTEELPVGTTELIYRITLLNESQKLTNSLASLLKSIPDPTGYSQGAAGLIHLTSAVSGDDTCSYAIFPNAENANLYLKNGKNVPCYEQKEKIGKDARLLNSSSLCLSNIPNLWFGFKNENWVMKQKIVLEVVPWVDVKASRGWTKTTKNEILELAKKSNINTFLKDKEAFLAAFLDVFTTKYKYSDYKSLLDIEKNKLVTEIADESIKKSGKLKDFLKNYNEFLKSSFEKNKEETILELLALNETRKLGSANEYDLLSMFYLETKQFQKAEEWNTKAFEKDKNQIIFQLHQAHIYLFTERISEAKDIHKKYKSQNIDSKTSWETATKKELEKLEKAGLETENFNKILRILE